MTGVDDSAFSREEECWGALVEAVHYAGLYKFDRLHLEACAKKDGGCGCLAFVLEAARQYARAHAEAHMERKRLARIGEYKARNKAERGTR